MRSLFDAWLVVLVTLWTTVCVCVCLEPLFDEKLTLLASASVDEARVGSWVVVQMTDTHTSTHKNIFIKLTSTRAQRQTVLGHLMCL